MSKIKNSPEEQRKAERKRFLARQKHKPVLAEKIKAREEKSNKKTKVFTEDLI
jgi:hypothetical protein